MNTLERRRGGALDAGPRQSGASHVSAWQAWWLAARPKTLGAALAPVLVGSACAWLLGSFAPWAALAALGGALGLQVGANFANDVFDFERGADTADRIGPARAVLAGWLSAGQMRRGMWLSFAAAAACGSYLVALHGWPVVVIGISGMLAGIGYTAGPWPLAYHGLGDLFVLVFFGFVAVAGTAFVHTGALHPLALWAAVPVGTLATAILVVNNLRDHAGDARAGKRTLVVRYGRRFGQRQFGLCVASAYALPVALCSTEWLGPAAWLPWLSAPEGLRLCIAVRRKQGAALNRVLADTGRLLWIFALLWSLGIVGSRAA